MENKRMIDMTPEDFSQTPVWEIDNELSSEEIVVVPLVEYPVQGGLDGRIVGTWVTLANWERRFAILSNISATNKTSNDHMIYLWVRVRDEWKQLARYHDSFYTQYGPQALASALELPVSEVFPIKYDLREIADGDAAALEGTLTEQPIEVLNSVDLIKLALEN